MSDAKTFVACVDPDERKRWMELVAVGKGHRIQYASGDYVLPPGERSERCKCVVAWWLKWVARGLWASPLLWLLHVLLPAPVDGLLLVLFVCVVVVFYALINVYVVVAVVSWRAKEKGITALKPPHQQPDLDSLQAKDLPGEDAAPPPIGSWVRVRGKVVALSRQRLAEGALIRDAWFTRAKLGRLTDALCFAVCSEGKPPVVLGWRSAPHVYAPATSGDSAQILSQMTERARSLWSIVESDSTGREVEVVTIAPGDEVEVTAAVAELIDDMREFELEDEVWSLTEGSGSESGSPYRHDGRQAGVVLMCDVEQPVHVVLQP